jgi:GNAT superfamily N-acetyltransferase
VDDLPALAGLRWDMEAEHRDASLDLDTYVAAYDAAIRGDLERGTFRAWLAEAEGEAVACVVLVWWMVPPHFEDLNRKHGWVSSVYCRPAYRRRGITRRLMEQLIEHARANNVQRVILWSSEMGRPLYESLGFAPSRALELNL